MGLFDKIFKSTPSEVTYSPKSEGEAFIGICFACMAADGDVAEVEIDRFSQIIVFKKFIDNKKMIDQYKTAHMIHKKIGSKAMIDHAVSSITEERKATLFAIVMELVLSDGILDSGEREIAEYLSESLHLEEETAQKIIEVMLIKNKDNRIVV